MKRLLTSTAVLAALLIPAAAQGAPAAPAWSLKAVPFPTNFAPGSSAAPAGPAYLVVATNVGGAPTSGAFTITDTLPGPLKPSVKLAPFGSYGHVGYENGKLSCTTAGHKITCTGTSPPVGPGEKVQMTVPVDVEVSAPPQVLDKASVEGGGAAPAATATVTAISSEVAPFDLLEGSLGLFGSTTAADGSTVTQAGSHPYQQTVAAMNFSLDPAEVGSTLLVPAGGGIRDVVAELPPGTVVNPGATPVRCTEAELETEQSSVGAAIETCPEASQVGTLAPTIGLAGLGVQPFPLYNMVPPPGHPAELGAEVIVGIYVHLLGSVRADGSFQLSAAANDILAKVAIGGVSVQLWGDPSDESHDALRGPCATSFPPPGGCHLAEPNHKAFISLPSSCGGPLTTTVHVDGWVEPDNKITRSYESSDLEGNPVGVDGCNALEFKPTIESKPTTNLADSPSGLDFDLHQPQEEAFEGLATANLKDVKVTLPAGMALNPSAGSGLDACSAAQIRLASAIGQAPIRFKEEAAACPDAAKIGSVEVDTPLLPDPLPGAVYLAKPFDNPFNSLLAIYIAVEDPKTGVIAKLPGKVEADPDTGQLTTSFTESPELPLEDVRLHLFTGPRASLTTPPACGSYTTTSEMTPWSTPEGANANATDSFQTTASPGGGACPTSAGAAASHPAFSAGTVSPQAGAYSPFVLKLSREDATQRISAIDTTLPEGLVAKLAGVSYCPESGIAQAMGRRKPNDGALEKASPSCPSSSEVGTVDVAAGSGITPLHAGGHAYLAGPYKGAPLSLVTIVPAVAGPFDLGAVAVRVALRVDPESTRIHAVSDPLPQILNGIPLDVRSIALEMGRPQFTLNPTSCEPMAVAGAAISPLGGSAALSSPFQVGGCSALPFKPKLSLRLKGGTKRGAHPALTAIATTKPGEANIAKVSVALPHSEFLDQSNLNRVCTRVQFAAGSYPGQACPAGSIYGAATAITPLLAEPLSGNVYLRSSSHELPDVVVALHGQVDVVVDGRVDSVNGGLRNSFEAVPDAPISKFVLKLRGGKKGLFENSTDICIGAHKATVLMDGQNGKVNDFKAPLKAKCGGKGRKGHRKKG